MANRWWGTSEAGSWKTTGAEWTGWGAGGKTAQSASDDCKRNVTRSVRWMASLANSFQSHAPPCSNRSVSGGGGTRRACWREAPRGLSHELVASHARVRDDQARAITCIVLFKNSAAAFELPHAPQTTDVSFSIPVVSVYECQKNE